MNVARLLTRAASVAPDGPAILSGEQVLCDYRGFATRAGQLAAQLPFAPGERIAILLHNCPEYLEVLWGAWTAGLAVVPINAKLHAREVDFILQDSGARMLFTTPELGAALPAGLARVNVGTRAYEDLFQGQAMPPAGRDAGDLAWLFYTSGTTGRPKGVMITHRNLLSMALCYFADVDAIDAGDAALYAAPMSHGAGLYCVPHVMAAARHVVPASGGFDPAEILALAPHLRQVSMFAAPTMVKRLVEAAEAQGASGEGLKTIVYGGGPMYAADMERAMAVMGPRFVQIYGQGECPMAITALSRRHLADIAHPRHAQRTASVGVAQSNVEVRVAAAGGEAGEVLVRGDTVMAGYWNNPRATQETLRDGWLHTGDVGVLDGDGFLTLIDRSKDLIISGGSNIYPREVEEVLLRHPAVREVAVIGRPDAEWGEQVVAYVVPRSGASLQTQELDALCLDHIARFKRPREYRLLAELPKNNYGKVLKTALRAIDAQAAGRTPSSMETSP
jgi:long-chain acyl-CoA synthetase